MPNGSGAAGTAKHLSIQRPPTSGGAVAARSSSTANGSRRIQPPAFMDQVPERPRSSQVTPRSTPSPAPQQATTRVQPLAQFHRPIVVPAAPEGKPRVIVLPRSPTGAGAPDGGSPAPSARGAVSAAPAVPRSELRIALPDLDAVSGLAEPSPEMRGASSTSVVGIFIFAAMLLLVCGWFGAVFLRSRASRR